MVEWISIECISSEVIMIEAANPLEGKAGTGHGIDAMVSVTRALLSHLTSIGTMNIGYTHR